MDISVIIPTYKRDQKLKECLRSLAQQQCPGLQYEVIVINDGGPLHTRKIVEQFSALMKTSYYFHENHGPGASRNTGIRYAKGDVIVFIDDDCVANVHWLANITKLLVTERQVCVVQGPYEYLSKYNPFYLTTRAISEIADAVRIQVAPEDSRQYSLYIGGANLAIRKSLILKHALYFDEELKTREDEDLFRRLAQKNIPVRYIKNPVIHNCVSGFISDYRRCYAYGQGEYLLTQKWGPGLRLCYNISLGNIRRKNSLLLAIVIWLIIHYRAWASHRGIKKARNKTLGVNLISNIS